MALLNMIKPTPSGSANVQVEGLANDNAWDADFQFIDGMRFEMGTLPYKKDGQA